MRRRVLIGLMTTFFVLMVSAIVWANMHRPRILVLHSYATDYVWTRDVNVGLRRVLDKQSWISTRYYYMDTKTSAEKDLLRRAGISARDMIDRIRPDVLIAMDDYAQDLAAKYYVNDPRIKIVFGGINGSLAPYGYDKARNVTGIIERKPAGAIKDVVTLLSQAAGKDPEKGAQVRVMLLADRTISTQRDAEYLKGYDWHPLIYREAKFVGDFESWKAAVRAAPAETDFLLVGGYRQLKPRPDSGPKERYVSAQRVMAWTEANSVLPVIGTNVFNTEDGAMLSVGISPYEQGEAMAEMARMIIEKGVPPKDIPVRTSRQYVVAFRKSALERRHIKVPQIFEAFARATDNYYP
jgi:hypothetical protein